MSAPTTPHVSLFDRLANFARDMEGKIPHAVTPNNTAGVLNALVLLLDHGSELLDAYERGGVPAAEEIMTPDRPEGWQPTVVNPQDPRDIQLQELQAQIRELQNAQGRNAYANPNAAPQPQAPAVPAGLTAPPITGPAPGPAPLDVTGAPYAPPAGVDNGPDAPRSPDETPDQTVARLERELAAARGNVVTTETTVEHDEPPTVEPPTEPPTGEPVSTDPPEGDAR